MCLLYGAPDSLATIITMRSRSLYWPQSL